MHHEQIEYFTLVYQTRNFSAAAKLVPMSPQGLSKSIHSLENELGVTLFTDVNGALTPTPYAEEFLRYANEVGISQHKLKESFKRIQAFERHEIRLGTSLGIIGFIGEDFIKRFEQENPEVQVIYNELNDTYCEDNLRNGTCDLAFTLAPYDGRFITTELYTTQVHFWVNTKKFPDVGAVLRYEDFEGRAIALPGKDFQIYKTLTSSCKAHGVTPEDIFTSAEIFWLYEFASRGKGYAFTLPHLARLSVFEGDEKVKAVPLEGVAWSFGISHLSTHKLLPHEKAFIDHCSAEIKKLLTR